MAIRRKRHNFREHDEEKPKSVSQAHWYDKSDWTDWDGDWYSLFPSEEEVMTAVKEAIANPEAAPDVSN